MCEQITLRIVTDTAEWRQRGVRNFTGQLHGNGHDGHWVEGTSDTNAPASRRALSATEGYWGPGVGLDVTWKPNPTGALGFFATGEAVWWIPRNSKSTMVDGYEPFNETVRAPSLSVGASWAVRVF